MKRTVPCLKVVAVTEADCYDNIATIEFCSESGRHRSINLTFEEAVCLRTLLGEWIERWQDAVEQEAFLKALWEAGVPVFDILKGNVEPSEEDRRVFEEVLREQKKKPHGRG